jgi:predicted lipoprotein with Yx(FWY)xxD motif
LTLAENFEPTGPSFRDKGVRTQHSEVTMTNKSQRITSRLPLLAGGVGILLLAAACGGSSGTAAPASSGAATAAARSTAVSTATTAPGKILVDTKGRTMYAFAADSKGKSNCTGTCLQYWPAVPAGAKPPTAPAGVSATFGVLHRQGGTTQLTVDGWPMYTYVGDSKPGATTGQGKNLDGGLWWVVSPSGKWITKDKASATKNTAGRYGSGY